MCVLDLMRQACLVDGAWVRGDAWSEVGNPAIGETRGRVPRFGAAETERAITAAERDDWNSLRHRLDGNRRCLAFFHPAMPGVPLIFIEVALTSGVSDRVGPILHGDDRDVPLGAPDPRDVLLDQQLPPGAGMAAQYGRRGIRTNVVAPGVLETPMTDHAWSTSRFRRMNFDMTPLDRTGTAEDAAAAIAFLLSDAARFITGQVLVVDGGWSSTKFLSDQVASADLS